MTVFSMSSAQRGHPHCLGYDSGWTPRASVSLAALTVAVLLAAAGCAPATLHEQGLLALERGSPNAAVGLLEQAVQTRPQDAELLRDLGIAYYRSQRFEDASDALARALGLKPDDGRTLFYLGASYERLDRPADAIATYRRFTELSSLPVLGDTFRGKVEARLRWLLERQAEAAVRHQLVRERQGTLEPPDERTLAVVPLSSLTATDLSASDGSGPVDSSRAAGGQTDSALAAALGDWITTDLAKLRAYRLVERARLDALLRELDLTESEAFDPSTRPRSGRLLGAGRLIGGTVTTLSEDQVLARMSVYDVRTAQEQAAHTARRTMNEFFDFEKDIVFGLVESMGITLSDLERREIASWVPTRNLNAFLAYGRGLLAERRGEAVEARLAYQDALDHDASFEAALGALRNLSARDVDLDGMTADLDAVAPATADVAHEAAPDPGTDDRLEETDGLTGGEFWPEDPRETRPWDQGTEIPDPPGLPERSTP